jgi:hypothetical protein
MAHILKGLWNESDIDCLKLKGWRDTSSHSGQGNCADSVEKFTTFLGVRFEDESFRNLKMFL